MTLRERIEAALERASKTGLARDCYPVLEVTEAENLVFLLATAAAHLKLDELAAGPDYDLLRIAGPDAPRQAAFDDDELADGEKRAILATAHRWEEFKPHVKCWLERLEAVLEESCTTP